MKLKTLAAALVALTLTFAAPRPAEAKLFEIWGSGLIGGGWGKGKTDKDFYQHASGGAAGFEVGLKILFIGVIVDYLHFFGGTSRADIMTFNLGGDWAIKIAKWFHIIIRVQGGYYYGILPDDNSVEVSETNTRGVGAKGGIGVRFNFLKVLSVGITPTVGYHYFFGGAHQSILDNNSHGVDIHALGYLRLGFGFL
jgi:hypothetical protein